MINNKYFSLLFGLLIFILPFNLFFVLDESMGYVNGMRIDYLMPKLYLSDFLLFLLTGVVLYNAVKHRLFRQFSKRTALLVIIAACTVLLTQFFTQRPLVGILWFLRWASWAGSVLYLVKHQKLLNKQIMVVALAAAVSFQVVIGIGQFTQQHSFFPSYLYFGEPRLNSGTIGLAKGSYAGEERLLAYGTTSHPNVLAGIIVLYALVLLSASQKHTKTTNSLAFIAVGIILFITQSWSAFLAFFLGIVLINFSAFKTVRMTSFSGLMFAASLSAVIALELAAAWFDSTSITRRHMLNQGALRIFKQLTYYGTGLGQFTSYLEANLFSKELIRFLQPAHNVVLLWLAETGLAGLAVITSLVIALKEVKVPILLLALIPLLTLDHYLYSTQSGMLLLGVFTVLAFVFSSSSPVEKKE